MKFFSKIILSLLAFSLLALPGSAWEQSFENSAQDIDESLFTSAERAGTGIEQYLNGTVYNAGYIGSAGQTTFFYINKSIDDHLEFTAYTERSSTGYITVGLGLYDENDSECFYDETFGTVSIPATGTGITRVEYRETTSGAGWDCYINGAKVDSSSYLSTPKSISRVKLVFWSNAGNCILRVDDFTTGTGIVATDPTCLYSDEGQTYKVGYPAMASSYWFVRIYDVTGEMINEQNVTSGIEYFIPSTELIQDGQYEIDLYRHYNTTGQNFYYTNKLFTNTLPSSVSLALIDQAYAPGDTVRITGHISPYYPGYYITISGSTGDPDENARFELTKEDQTFLYTIPSTAVDGGRVVCLRSPAGSPLKTMYFDIAGGTSGTSIRFDKNVYTNTNEISIRYTDIPSDATIQVKGTFQGTEIFSNSYSKTGSGIFVHNLLGENINKITVQVIQKGIILDSDFAEVANGEYQVSGVIYDTEDKTTISGALISCAGRQATSGAYGKFSLIVPAGTQTFQISADGYTTQTISIDVVNIQQTNNFYLVAVPLAGENPNMLYGLVTDRANGEPLQSAYIQITNQSTGVSYSTLSWSDTGHYSFDYSGMAGAWTIVVQKTGYENYKTVITISGQTYLNIQMQDADEAADDPLWSDPDNEDEDNDGIPDNTDNEDGRDSGDITGGERPGRQAAKDSMEMFESIVPGLIGIALLRVLMELLT